MTRKMNEDEQPLFDFDAAQGPQSAEAGITHTHPFSSQTRETALPDAEGESGLLRLSPEHDWQEVPQARFLSWPAAMQDAYCRARDLHAASIEDEPWHKALYLRRAEAYR